MSEQEKEGKFLRKAKVAASLADALLRLLDLVFRR